MINPDPEATVRVHLPSHASRPEDERPTLTIRNPRRIHTRRLKEFVQRIRNIEPHEVDEFESTLNGIVQTIAELAVSWKGSLPGAGADEASKMLEATFNEVELMELAGAVCHAVFLGGDEKNSSGSPSTSSTGSAAIAASPEGVPTSQPSPTPSSSLAQSAGTAMSVTAADAAARDGSESPGARIAV